MIRRKTICGAANPLDLCWNRRARILWWETYFGAAKAVTYSHAWTALMAMNCDENVTVEVMNDVTYALRRALTFDNTLTHDVMAEAFDALSKFYERKTFEEVGEDFYKDRLGLEEILLKVDRESLVKYGLAS